jgi:hypothetical protein
LFTISSDDTFKYFEIWKKYQTDKSCVDNMEELVNNLKKLIYMEELVNNLKKLIYSNNYLFWVKNESEVYKKIKIEIDENLKRDFQLDILWYIKIHG